MAAYAALVSVMQIIDQIQHHPRPPISLDEKQVESLTQIITFLQEFLEGYNPHLTYTTEEDPLESRIADAAYAAEDVIESYIVDQILSRSTNHGEKISTSIEFYQGLQKVIEEMDVIKMEVVEMKEKMGVQHHQLHIIKSHVTDAGSFRSTSTSAQNVTMVGSDDVLYQMLEKITRGRLDRQIIPIVGMGGIGKTTLARNVYVNPLVQQYFDVCAWSTISQVYSAQKILREILAQVDKENKDGGDLSEDELGEKLYKYLRGRRYLIVMDDMWSIEAWDGVRIFFPDNGNGSRIVVTTRLSNLASQFNYSNGLDMKFLDEASSWNLFCKTVFGEEICPDLELEDTGKKIVKGCKGLPLSIVVIGGLLSKSGRTRENWESVEGNLNSIVNLEDNERCLQILYMSYNNLPVYIKPCFLYTAIFQEDAEFPVSFFIKLWVAEGFLKPIHGKSLEEAAEEYAEELVDRNLILVEKRNHYGKLKTFKIHDLLRDLSLREAQKVKFLCVLGEQSIHHIVPQGIYSQRRILSKYPSNPVHQSLASASLVRSLIGGFPKTLSYNNFRLLRVSLSDKDTEEERSSDQYYEEAFLSKVNLRFFGVDADLHPLSGSMPSSVSFLWNLETLVLAKVGLDFIFEIRKMPQLRHVLTYNGTLDGSYCLPDPYSLSGDDMGAGQDGVVLENLQTLYVVSNLYFGEGVLKRIPNIKKLKLEFSRTSKRGVDYCLNNLGCLHKLQSLGLRSIFMHEEGNRNLVRNLTLPYSLKKLTLEGTNLPWEDMKTKIGWLPLLQVLKLKQNSFSGLEWETVEGQFSSLKFLLIESCDDLKYWTTDDSTHFPRLEHLVLRRLRRLREIPLTIGDIPTLQSIELEDCCDSAVDSARRIQEEQEELGNEGLQLHVVNDETLRYLRSLYES